MMRNRARHVCVLTLTALALGLAASAASAQDIKIAVVDLEAVVAQSAKGRALQTQLEAFQQQVQVEADTLAADARDLRKRMAEGANTLTDEKLSDLNKQYEDKTIEMRRLRDDKQREGQKIQAEGLREIEQQLEPVFKAVRDEGGYDLILNNAPGIVVMSSERVDITDLVVQRLNAAQQ